jgi:hypothetical protein
LFDPLADAIDNMPTTWDGLVDCVQQGGKVIDCKEKMK